MKKFLSIGEVSKIKGVSVKSLRYYEQLGILKPAYVNKGTGYRYYTVDQLLIVDLIYICIELNIPLKNFKNYLTAQENIDIHHLMTDGEQIINEKIQKLQKTKQFLSNLSEHVTRTNRVKTLADGFLEQIPDRYLLTIDYEDELFDYKAINQCYSKLIKQSLALETPDKLNQGFFIVHENGQYKRKIFLEIQKPSKKPDNLIVVKNQMFRCSIRPFQEFGSIQSSALILIVKELFDLTIHPTERLVEIQESVTPQ